MSATLRIPDILAAMNGFELRTHPDEEKVTDESNKWFSSYNMLPRDKYDGFVKSKFGLLVGMAYPDTDANRLRVTCDYMSILFTYDDLMDLPTSDLMHDRMGADKAARIMMDAISKPHEFKPIPGLPVATAFHDFWLRFCSTSTPGMQKRFIDANKEYVLAARNQVGNREGKQCPSIEEYIALRRDTSAIKVTYACIEYTLQVHVPDEAFHHPAVESFCEAGNDILSWANDIYSFDNEQACGDCHNLVAVVSIQKNITVQAAVEYANSMVLSAIDRFFAERDRIPSFGPEVDRIVQAYIKGVEVYISGSVFWHLESERYFGPRVQKVKETLTVDLRPLEPGAKPSFELMYNLPHILHAPIQALSSAPSSAPSTVVNSPNIILKNLPFGDSQSGSTFSKRKVSFVQGITRRDVTNILVFTSILLASLPRSFIPVVPLALLLVLPEPFAALSPSAWTAAN